MKFVVKGREVRGELEDDRMLTFELEAAEALAGLSRYSSVRREGERRRPSRQILAESQDQGMDVEQFSGDTAAKVADPTKNTKNFEAAIGQTCSTSGRPKVCKTLKQNLTEDQRMDVEQFSGDTAATVAAPMNNTKNVEAAIDQTCSTSARPKVCRTLTQNWTEYQRMDIEQFSGDTAATVAAPMNNTNNVEAAIGQTCSTSARPKVCRTLKQNWTEAEKEARKLSRILANRESARRTIRHRQTMYRELTGKAANLLEENMYLKKEKELVMKKHNHLKDKNGFLKAEMAKRKMAEAGERREDQSNSSHAEISTAASVTTPPFFLYNHPSFVPFFWPPVVPSSDSVSSHYISNPDGTIPTLEKPCSDQGQKGTGGINTKPGTPVFLLPVPWLLPFLSQVGAPESPPVVKQKNEASHIHQCRTCSSSVAHIQEDNHQLPSNGNVRADGFRHGFLEKNRGRPLMSPSRKLKKAMAAGEARIKRKELMKLKHGRGDNSHTQ